MNSKLRYIVRVLKSFLWFAILFAIMVSIIVLFVPEYSFDMIFRKEGGMFTPGSEYKIFILFIAISAIYPAVKYVKKEAVIKGNFDERRDEIFEVFRKMGYVFVSENAETVTFRLEKKSLRFMRMYEDRITITKGESPLILRGDRKEIIRLSENIMYALMDKYEENPYDYGDTETSETAGIGNAPEVAGKTDTSETSDANAVGTGNTAGAEETHGEQ